MRTHTCFQDSPREWTFFGGGGRKTPISLREVGQGSNPGKAAPSGKEAREEDRVSLNFSH